jgi:spermidine/putrescine-binding protein
LRCNGYGGDYDRILTENVAKPLEEKTGLVVQYQPGSTQADMVKLISSKDNPPYDLFMGDSPHMAQMIPVGVTLPITAADVPSVSRILPGFREFGDYGVPFSVANVVPVYNSARIKTPLTGYSDIARPDLKGRLILPSGAQGSNNLLLLALAEANGGGMDNLEPALEIVRKAKDNVISLYESTVAALQMLDQEEAWGGIYWDGRAFSLRQKNKPIETVVPKEGIYSVLSYINVVNGTKHKEAAFAYVEQLLSDQGMLGIPGFFRYGPTTDVVMPEAMRKDVLINSPERVALKRKIDWAKLATVRAEWTERFNRALR